MEWTHAICLPCWWERTARQGYPCRVPVRIKAAHREQEACCFCHTPTKSGVYVREDPRTLTCTHPES